MNDPSLSAGEQLLADRYVLQERLGSGGAGAVWRAHDRRLDRTVAVKLLHADTAGDAAAGARFRAEATAAAKLSHPHAVTVYDVGAIDDREYLVMELVDGGTLAEVLQTGPLPPGVVAALGAQVGQALGAAHVRGFVHRDVTPTNVLISRSGVVKVADFGIARALGDATSRLTAPGHVVGTARYLAPEQLRDEQLDARADVYALGLLLHEAVTGEPPFGQGTTAEIALRRLAHRLPRASELRAEVPAALDEALDRATRLDPTERFADGGELAAALADLAAPDAADELASRLRHRHPAEQQGARSGPSERPAALPGAAAASTVAFEPDGGATPSDRGGPPDGGGDTQVAPVGDAGADLSGDATTRLDRTAASSAPAATEPSHDRGPDEDVEVGDRGRRGWLVVAMLLVLLAAGAGLALLGGEDADEPTADDEAATDEAEEVDDAVIEVVDGADHDPFGSGEEHPGDVPNAFDGDPSTTWQTQGYRGDPALGGLKPGVGIWVDLGEAQPVGEVVVTMANPGASFTLYAGDEPPGGGDDPDEWGSTVASVEDAAEEARVELDDGLEARVWLLWFTSLAPEGGEYRARVADVRFEGP